MFIEVVFGIKDNLAAMARPNKCVAVGPRLVEVGAGFELWDDAGGPAELIITTLAILLTVGLGGEVLV